MTFTIQQAHNLIALAKSQINFETLKLLQAPASQDHVILLGQALESLSKSFEKEESMIELFPDIKEHINLEDCLLYKQKLIHEQAYRGKTLAQIQLTSHDWAAFALYVFQNTQILDFDNLKVIAAHRVFCIQLKSFVYDEKRESQQLQVFTEQYFGQLQITGQHKYIACLCDIMDIAHLTLNAPNNEMHYADVAKAFAPAMMQALHLNGCIYKSANQKEEGELGVLLTTVLLGSSVETLRQRAQLSRQSEESYQPMLHSLRQTNWEKKPLSLPSSSTRNARLASSLEQDLVKALEQFTIENKYEAQQPRFEKTETILVQYEQTKGMTTIYVSRNEHEIETPPSKTKEKSIPPKDKL